MRSATRRFLVAALVGASIMATAWAADRGEAKKAARVDDRAPDQVGTVSVASPDSEADVVPLPASAVFDRIRVGPAQEGTVAGTGESLVYSNTKGIYVLGPNAGVRVADDITTVGAFNCKLKRFVFRVTGDRDNNPNIDEGPFTVKYALYPTCPGSTVCTAGDNFCPTPIGGTSGQITLPDENFHEIEVNIPDSVCLGGLHDGSQCFQNSECQPTCQGGTNDGQSCGNVLDCPGGTCPLNQVGVCGTEVDLPSSFYLAVTFSRQKAGIVVGAPPLVGVSADRYDAGSFACASAFGGFPAYPHASFYAEFYVDDTCPIQFPAYHNSMQAGAQYSAGPQKLFADDVTLGVDAQDCNMVAYEVALRGARSNSQGGVRVDLYSKLSVPGEDPFTTGIIPGTRMERQVYGKDVQLLRRTFSTPVPLADYLNSNTDRSLFVVFRSTSSEVGPINTCRQAKPGSTLDVALRYIGDTPDGEWTPFDLGGSCHSAFETTIYCDGEAPPGACCDILLREDQSCVGGSHPDMACTADSDCVCEPACQNGTCTNFTCVGGPFPGSPCFTDTECACPSNTCLTSTCNLTTHKCVGGPRNNLSCTSNGDCLYHTCDGGPNDGQPCTTAANCDFPQPCDTDGYCVGEAVCREVAEVNCATSDPARWVKGEHCGPVCHGGSADGESCATDADCPNVCVNGDTDNGTPCTANIDCQGQCDIGLCQGSFCNGGVNDALPCTRQADCPGGVCDDQPFVGRRACGLGACCGCLGGPCTAAPTQCLNGTERECFEATVESARLYFPGGNCNLITCPWGACLSREGDCTVARPAFCRGGDNDGMECDPDGFLSFECPPGFPETACETEVGCEDPTCCTDVCNIDSFCCTVWWDFTCATTAAQVCTPNPQNDRCADPEDPDKGAYLVDLSSGLFSIEADLIHSLTTEDEPGACCLTGDPGGDSDKNVWYKFVAPERNPGDTTVSVNISTCNSVGRTIDGTSYPADDSVLQVFSVADLDTGVCDDLSACSVSAQDCIDASTCRVTNRLECQNLIPIGCNDNYGSACPAPGGGSEPNNAQICLPDLTVGDTYYVMVGATPPSTKICDGGEHDGETCNNNSDCGSKCVGGSNARDVCTDPVSAVCPDPRCEGGPTPGISCTSNLDCGTNGNCTCCPGGDCVQGTCEDVQHTGIFQLTFTTGCAGGQLIPNDICTKAYEFTGTSAAIPFDLSGGTTYAPVTFDCPGTSCVSSLKNDVWYDWIAPANGAVEINTCGGFGQVTPDTSMVVYDGCECPINEGTVLGCSDLEFGADCAGGSRVRFNAIKGNCYKVRLGGRNGATNIAGNLNLLMTSCPDGAVTFDDPQDGTVDARQPYPPTSPNTGQGIQDFTITAMPGVNIVDRPGSQGQFSCWNFCETDVDASALNNKITNITDNFDGTFNVHLQRPITPGAVTTLSYLSGDGTMDSTAVFTAHAGNVDGGPVADVGDVTALMDYLTGAAAAPWGMYSMDLDHSGAATPADILRAIDLLQGAHSFSASVDTPLPLNDVCAP